MIRAEGENPEPAELRALEVQRRQTPATKETRDTPKTGVTSQPLEHGGSPRRPDKGLDGNVADEN